MPDINDPNNDKSRLESRIGDLEELPRTDRQLLQYWLTNFRDRYADSTTLGHLTRLLTLYDELEMPLSETTKFDWTAVITELANERAWTSGTKRNYQKSVRSFLDEVEDDVAANKDEISLAKDDSGGKIDPDDVLSIEETRVLIYEASNRIRDQAMFATLVDLGLRVAALCSLRRKHFEFKEGSAVGEITLNDEALGQKGSGGRTHVATISCGFIRSYLRSEHPRPDDEQAPLFHKVGGHYDQDDPEDDGSISPAIFRRRMRRLARHTDIDESKLHPHNLKHAAVTIWAQRGMSDREIEYRAGWARESGQLKRYEHLTEDEVNNQILNTLEIEVEDRKNQTISPIDVCPNCGVSIDTGMRYCPQCGQKIDQDLRPAWFEEYIDEYGEDDDLVTTLLESPAVIAENPSDLPESLKSIHQDKIENVVGYSLFGAIGPMDSDNIQATLPREDGDGELTVHVPFAVAQDYDPGKLSVRQSRNGLLSLVTEEGDVVGTVDPLGID